ncbi:MAG: mechanosensitive ion channel family protein [Candidatus Diapherotrites archaeon]
MLEGFFTIANGWLFANDLTSIAIRVILILAITFILGRLVHMFLSKHFKRTARKLKIDETQFIMVKRVASLLIYIFGVMIALSQLPDFQSIWVSIFASAGIIAIVVGLAAQPTLSNVVAGIFMTTFRPFRVGDKVRIQGEYGAIEDITLRHTVLKTWDNRRIIIPNSKMNDEYIMNYTISDPRILGYLDIMISYDSDVSLAKKIMVEEALAHSDILDATKDADLLAGKDSAFARIREFQDNGLQLRLYFWVADQPKFRRMRAELFETIKKRFQKEGVEIPYPYRTIVYKTDLPKTTQLRNGIDEKQKRLELGDNPTEPPDRELL